MSESLLAISNAIKIGKVWKNFADIKIPEEIPNLKKKIKTYSENTTISSKLHKMNQS